LIKALLREFEGRLDAPEHMCRSSGRRSFYDPNAHAYDQATDEQYSAHQDDEACEEPSANGQSVTPVETRRRPCVEPPSDRASIVY
jgi:hypothetical protein